MTLREQYELAADVAGCAGGHLQNYMYASGILVVGILSHTGNEITHVMDEIDIATWPKLPKREKVFVAAS